MIFIIFSACEAIFDIWYVYFFKVFMKSVKLEWCLGDIKKANDLLDESVKHYPNFPKVRYLQA